MNTRHTVLALLLAGALAAAFWPAQDADDAEDVVGAVVRPQPSPSGREGHSLPPSMGEHPEGHQGGGEGSELKVRFASGEARNLFPSQNFRPPPPPPTPAPPPPPPMAPPVPFSFVGAWTENGAENVFLDRGGQLITTRVGETLPGGWRLDAVSAEALILTYVSLNQQRTLRIAP